MTLSVSIGGMVWGVEASGAKPFDDPSAYAPFLTDLPSTQRLAVRAGERRPAKGGAPLFDSGTTWTLHEIPSGYLMTLPSERSRWPARGSVRLSADFQAAEVFPHDHGLSALPYPFDQLWAVHLLARGGGLLCHGCAVAHEGRGLLFLGHSGDGKTTMARLWSAIPGATILSDERIIIRQESGGYRLYGTPWPGEGRFFSPRSAPLNRLYILAHGPANRIASLTSTAATAEVLSRSLAPFWHRALMAHSLMTASALCRAAEVRRLEFVPDRRVVEFLQT